MHKPSHETILFEPTESFYISDLSAHGCAAVAAKEASEEALVAAAEDHGDFRSSLCFCRQWCSTLPKPLWSFGLWGRNGWASGVSKAWMEFF